MLLREYLTEYTKEELFEQCVVGVPNWAEAAFASISSESFSASSLIDLLYYIFLTFLCVENTIDLVSFTTLLQCYDAKIDFSKKKGI